MSFTSSISQGTPPACQAGYITELKPWGDREAEKGQEVFRGLRWAETFWCQCYVKENLVSLGLCFCAGGGSCAPVQEANCMARVLMSALVLANGWESVGHKEHGIFL